MCQDIFQVKILPCTAKAPLASIVLHDPSMQASCVQDLPDHIEAVAKVLPGLRQEIWGDVDQTDPGDQFMVSSSNLNNGASP